MTMVDTKRRALGRGLDALLPAAPSATSYADKNVFTCPLEKIVPQKGQPRQHFVSEIRKLRKVVDERETEAGETGV